jgi:hypothetical protein
MGDMLCVEFSGGTTDHLHRNMFDRGCIYGRALLKAMPWLDGLARELGVQPLSAFVSGGEKDSWFSSDEGYRTVIRLADALKAGNREPPGGDVPMKDVVWDLTVIMSLLKSGHDEGVTFHLAAKQ